MTPLKLPFCFAPNGDDQSPLERKIKTVGPRYRAVYFKIGGNHGKPKTGNQRTQSH